MKSQNITCRGRQVRSLLGLVVPAALLLMTPAAQAVDGCKVMLCIAGNWKNIAPCRPTVEQALSEVARGKGWPSCSMGGSGQAGGSSASGSSSPGSSTSGSDASSASPSGSDKSGGAAPGSLTSYSEHQWTVAPGNCPEQYVLVQRSEGGPVYSCLYDGVVNVWVNGSLWSRLWWRLSGDTSTQYSAEALARLGDAVDPKFQADGLAWQAAQEAAAKAAAVAAQAGDGG